MSELQNNNVATVDEKLKEIIWENPLYTSYQAKRGDSVSHRVLFGVLYDTLIHDAHCIWCEKNSTFKKEGRPGKFQAYSDTGIAMNYANKVDPADESWQTTVHFICQRSSDHIYRFFFLCSNGKLMKIGQFPSLEDISGVDIQRFRKILDPKYFSDLRRAGGLASHGIGAGAFVYLRRIFEKLIDIHHKQYLDAGGRIEDFEKLRMMEKVEALSSVLPEPVLEFKKVYSILSMGVHELDEDTCKAYFPVVKAIIILILEEDLQNRARAEAAANTRLAMQKILSDIGSSER